MVTTTERGMGFAARWSVENGCGKSRRKRDSHSTTGVMSGAVSELPVGVVSESRAGNLSERLSGMVSGSRVPGNDSSNGYGDDDNRGLHLSWLPLYCERALKSAVERHELVIFVKTARLELHRRMNCYFNSYKNIRKDYFTIEERNAIEVADSLKTGELMGNHRTLKYLEKYLQTGSRAHLIKAREHYRNSEEVWKRLLEHLKELVMINILGRRCLSFQ